MKCDLGAMSIAQRKRRRRETPEVQMLRVTAKKRELHTKKRKILAIALNLHGGVKQVLLPD